MPPAVDEMMNVMLQDENEFRLAYRQAKGEGVKVSRRQRRENGRRFAASPLAQQLREKGWV